MPHRILIIVISCALFQSACASAAVIASDHADDPAYSDGWQLSDNGGIGFDNWNEVEAIGGGFFLENSGRQVDGTQSFAIFAGDQNGSGYGLSRPLSTPLTTGSFSVLVRNDLDNSSGFAGINLKSIPGPLFGGGELLSIGLEPTSVDSHAGNNDVVVNGATSQYLSPNGGELRGDVLRYTVGWDTDAGTYDVTVDDLTNGGSASTSGTLKASGQAVAAFGFGNFDSGGFHNLIFNDLQVSSVPEPTSLGILAVGFFALSRRRRVRG